MTDFKKDLQSGRRFWLGPVVASHQLGEYQFIEYRERDFSVRAKKHGEFTGKHGFSIYHNGASMGISASSLEGAYISAVARAWDGLNSQAALMFMRMIGMAKKEPDKVFAKESE